ncbi:HupE/UreJ family protein [Nostoc sp. CHAB 5844]|nr:HupE/UreJ family protein [Nostoc sp. CHAB 5844]
MLKDKLLQRHVGAIATLGVISLLSSWSALPSPHEISNSWDGFLWGMADPVLALDKLVSILAIGLLAVGKVRGRLVAIALILANFVGTLIHLLQINLPVTEVAIAMVSIAFGMVLVTLKQPNFITLLILTAIAGLFQGYFHSESIIEAETIPSVMYILGTALTQYAMVMSASQIATQVSQTELLGTLPRKMSLVGFAICALGIVCLKSWIN